MQLLIKNGTVVDPADKIHTKADILIENGIIKEVNPNINIKGVDVIDASGKTVMPGLVDMHCHLRDPGYESKEDIVSGSLAAAKGGFTSIACMANTEPVADNKTVITYIRDKARSKAAVKVYPFGAVTKGLKGMELADAGELKEAGAIALSDDGMPVQNGNIMKLALQYAKNFDMLIVSHCEDKDLVNEGVMNEGFTSTMLGLNGIPAVAEEVMVARDVILAGYLDTRIHIAHVSTKGSIDIIRFAKQKGIKVTCETAPHYYSADDSFVDGYDTNTKVNPPLRSLEDVEAVKQGLKDGTIDIIATDHAPHHRNNKEVEYDIAACGISGFETAFSLSYTNLIKTGVLSLDELVNKMSVKPSEILGIKAGKLKACMPADIIVTDLNKKFKIDVSKFRSKGKNSPFDGKEVYGDILYTIVDGNIKYKKNV